MQHFFLKEIIACWSQTRFKLEVHLIAEYLLETKLMQDEILQSFATILEVKLVPVFPLLRFQNGRLTPTFVMMAFNS